MNPVNRVMPEICAFHPGEPKPTYLLDKLDQIILDLAKKEEYKIKKHIQDSFMTDSDRDSPNI